MGFWRPILSASICIASISLWMPVSSQGHKILSRMRPISNWLAGRTKESPSSGQKLQWLRRQAQSITATVWVGSRWSSGVLIHRQGTLYTVITNQHVVDFGQTFHITMPDGRRYEAHLKHSSRWKGDDLALLEFRSPEVAYPLATLASSVSLSPGTPVFAGGFPSEQKAPQFHFTTGQVSMISTKTLQGGYQIGYTNQIEKGMSGGPVLNHQGQVVALNGMHAYPLWGNPYIFTDGSQPSRAEKQVMQRSSWAISSERLLKLLPKTRKVKR